MFKDCNRNRKSKMDKFTITKAFGQTKSPFALGKYNKKSIKKLPSGSLWAGGGLENREAVLFFDIFSG